MTPTLLDLALKAGFSDPIEGWMGEAYEERLEAFAKLIIEHEAEKQTEEPVAFRFKERPDDLRSAWLYVSKRQHVPHGWPYQALNITGETKWST